METKMPLAPENEFDATGDIVLALMRRYGMPMTRETYLQLVYRRGAGRLV
jgi:hypothetical protein